MDKSLKVVVGVLAAIAVVAFAAAASHHTTGADGAAATAASSDDSDAKAAEAAASDAAAAATEAMNATARQTPALSTQHTAPDQPIDGVTITRDEAITADEVFKAGGVANCDWLCQDRIRRREDGD